ncbi:MAG: hypothetical protein NTZ80_02005 [Patescibacteria group bacterium]|nr:hypothetical protein [Patescibacteria group bacterium]
MQQSLKSAVLETLGYYFILNCPLSFDELYQRLHNVKITRIELKKFLQSAPKGIIFRDGFYALVEKKNDIELRKLALTATEYKWQILSKRLELLRRIPFLRGVCVSGSMSAGYANNDSDIDIFIIAKKNRIWLCRGFLAFFMKRAGWYRQEENKQVQNYLCPNHFITEDSLLLKPHNIYTAHLFSQFSPIIGQDICEKLRLANLGWIREFLPNSHGQIMHEKNIPDPIRSEPETFLIGPFGWLWEKVAQFLQLRKIKSNKDFREKFARGGLRFSKKELTFHGRPQEPEMLEKFGKIKLTLPLD